MRDVLDRLEILAAWLKPGGQTPDEPIPDKYSTLVEAIAEIKRSRKIVARSRPDCVHRGAVMTPEQYMRQALELFIIDPPDSDFQQGYLEGLKVFANEAMGFKWDDPLIWGEGGQRIETKAIERPKLKVIEGGRADVGSPTGPGDKS